MFDHFKVPEDIAVRVPLDRLRAATEAVFLKCGVPADDAALGADALMFADLAGIDTHGVSNKLRDYAAKFQSGVLNPTPNWTIVTETASTAVIDGDGGLGLLIAPKAMSIAMDKADKVGSGMVSIRNAGHAGAAGYHARLALERDMIGWCMTVSSASKSMLPTYGAEPLLGTNPIAFAAPADKEAAFLFDAAMTTIAGNKIGLAKRMGKPLQGGWVAHADGTPDLEGGPIEKFSTEGKPNQLPLGSTRELGSHKGYGMAMIVDILCGQLSFAPGYSTLADDRGGHFVAAWDVAAFGEPSEFKRNMDGMLGRLRTSKPMAGAERVYYAGLIEVETEQERRERGIPLHPEVVDWFRQACDEFDIPFDLA
ncbi:MAG: Ldh family oxidoreductase [Nitriliruptoraceae bacterium]